MCGFAELGAEFGNRIFVAGVLVGEPLGAVGFPGLDGGPGGKFRSESGQVGALLDGLGLPALKLLPGRGQLA